MSGICRNKNLSGNQAKDESHFLLDCQKNASARVNLYIAIGSISKQFSKLDHPDKFIYMLSAGADVPKHIATFIIKTYHNMR